MGEKVKIDDRGRITIPTELREKYGISSGDELKIEDIKGQIVLKPIHQAVKKLKYGRKWNKQAFFKAGAVTFED